MRFNNNLLLLASFLGVATAFRRRCNPDLATQRTGIGSYTWASSDNWTVVAADFCSSVKELQEMNAGPTVEEGNVLRVPCRYRKRDCARIQGSDNGYYTVVDSDDLSLIAADFCTTDDGLKSLNSDLLANNTITLTPGLIVQVPCTWN
ncbi:uncharacterized protein L3040_008168 [Drepanopeziza brunnea f. sp. 'multigermtubi']|uniref:LysM11p n=2 Tax=Drepanopeziza brunnea f. sp. 'multigermtubi' TaxID=698441 RepID=J9XN74_9HELO|nr:putative Ecp7(P20) [Drepanopeziza brunnea f. sp. 'multigermtubi' MB_m1]AFS30729.1 LysM11p [Drepanopeziza brunnea f. sp. 'multigermtubi']EKD12507.1 putative Ecp7(P20) [Drepanopeziza brunnea f. sp. 'multigermtubi' MB_m1]KAJ5034900.1 hypothetical protein L3040_008168 [Drepanopeziza brunnea f. sp. 'multigermtubi']